MALSYDLISQFVRVTNDKTKNTSGTTVYGVVKTSETSEGASTITVQLDGSEDGPCVPVTSTSNVTNGERVLVSIKDHKATIIGNITSPSVTIKDQKDLTESVTQLYVLVADRATIDMLNVERARIDTLETDSVTVKGDLEAAQANIVVLMADNATIKENVSANTADIEQLKSTTVTTDILTANYATIESLEALDLDVRDLDAAYAEFETTVTNRLDAVDANISDLDANKLSVETAAITYANIDFSNIGTAAMETFYSKSGLIEDVVVGDETITGYLVGVTIKGDTIEANTIVADKLVIQGEDGIFYKLNTDGSSIEAEQTEYNSLNGQVITAKSITATQISVSDLVAFDATIGGFTITDNSLYSTVKDDEGNFTRGVYMDSDGQVSIGDGDRFIKYIRDEDGTWKLTISVDTILYDVNGNQRSIADLDIIGEYVKIDTYEDEPCIELGETDSDFKLRITNTRMLFMEGSNVIAHVTNQSLHINKAVIEEELQQGSFVWKARSNGNLGLIWKGGTT